MDVVSRLGYTNTFRLSKEEMTDMNHRIILALISSIIVLALLMSAAAFCVADEPNASVNGSVTYRERIALTEGATLVIELRDVSYADAAAPLIARQTITNPGQVPIDFEIEYSRQDIESRNTYSISATIFESDGRMAFTNDTAYDVITGGNPNKVDMLLIVVQPPPDMADVNAPDWQSWIEVPAEITGAHLLPGELEPTLRVTYLQSDIENCALRGAEHIQVDGNDIILTVTLMERPESALTAHCDDKVVELDTIQQIGPNLKPGETYRVVVNDKLITTITVPAVDFAMSASGAIA
ncbi:MAG: hypothetical protein F4X40_04995 [Chloroflexi bacterium]|nr:hypothetical protein [Chloroflexota bacterium]